MSRPPFAHLAPALRLAGLAAAVEAVWVVAGQALPGRRWMAVYAFTLGVITPLVAVLSLHLAAQVLHADRPGTRRRLAVLAAGAAALVGLPAG